MSRIDDEAAEFDAKLTFAREKCRYGRTYSPANKLARRIKDIRHILKGKEEEDADPTLDAAEKEYLVGTAGLLLICAITESDKLRQIANALDDSGASDPAQARILDAYEDCISGRYLPTVLKKGACTTTCSIPTLVQVKDALQKRFGTPTGRSDFSLRKTLKMFGLPLTEGTKGRPRGAETIISNRKS